MQLSKAFLSKAPPACFDERAGQDETEYYIDNISGLVARMEFDYAWGQDPLSGQMAPLTEVYEFSNYQDVALTGTGLFASPATAPAATVKFPMVIDRYIVGRKVETMVFTQVLLNQNIPPREFFAVDEGDRQRVRHQICHP